MSKKEVKQVLSLKYGQRGETRTLTFPTGEGDISFKIQGLSNRVSRFIQGKPDDEMIFNTVKHGLVEVTGWTDESGAAVTCQFEKADVFGKQVECLTDEFVEGIPDNLKNLLTVQIGKLSTVDLDALDFTIA